MTDNRYIEIHWDKSNYILPIPVDPTDEFSLAGEAVRALLALLDSDKTPKVDKNAVEPAPAVEQCTSRYHQSPGGPVYPCTKPKGHLDMHSWQEDQNTKPRPIEEACSAYVVTAGYRYNCDLDRGHDGQHHYGKPA